MSWTRWIFEVALAEEDFIVVAMDETAIVQSSLLPVGNVVCMTRRDIDGSHAFKQRTNRSTLRKHCTYAACITNEASLQAKLPQILLPKDTTKVPLTAQEKLFLDQLPPPLSYLKGTTGWVNDTIMITIVSRIQRAVATHRPGAKLVFVADCAKQHLGNRFLNYMAQQNILPLLIPGGLTWLLQILDAVIFSLFKRRLRELMTLARLQHPDGLLPKHMWMQILAQGIVEHFVMADWAAEFPRYAQAPVAGPLSSRLLEYMPPEAPIVPRPLTLEELKRLTGQQRTIPFKRKCFGAGERAIKRRVARNAGHELEDEPTPIRLALPSGSRMPTGFRVPLPAP
jgi:hypothetical protein